MTLGAKGRLGAALAAALAAASCVHGPPSNAPDRDAGAALESSSIAYARADGVYLARGDGREETRLIAADRMARGTVPFLASLSPDGKRVLFVALSALDPRTDRGGGLSLHVLELHARQMSAWREVHLDRVIGGPAGAPVEAAMVPAASWSPDSSRIAMALRRRTLAAPDLVVLFDAEGNPRRGIDLESRRLVAGSGLAWDGGEALLLAIEGHDLPGIARLALESGRGEAGGMEVIASGRDPAVSPDGTQVAAVAADDGGPAGIVLMDRSGRETRRFDGLAGRAPHHLFWSGDGRYLYYHSLASTGPLGIMEIGLLRCLDTREGRVFDLVRLG